MPRPLYPRKRNPIPNVSRLCGHQNRSGRVRKIWHLEGFDPRTVSISEWLHRLSYPGRRSNPSSQSWHKLFLLLLSCHSISGPQYRRVAHIHSCLHRNGAVVAVTQPAGRPEHSKNSSSCLNWNQWKGAGKLFRQLLRARRREWLVAGYWALGKC
jgi:hypothetical protein